MFQNHTYVFIQHVNFINIRSNTWIHERLITQEWFPRGGTDRSWEIETNVESFEVSKSACEPWEHAKLSANRVWMLISIKTGMVKIATITRCSLLLGFVKSVGNVLKWSKSRIFLQHICMKQTQTWILFQSEIVNLWRVPVLTRNVKLSQPFFKALL